MLDCEEPPPGPGSGDPPGWAGATATLELDPRKAKASPPAKSSARFWKRRRRPPRTATSSAPSGGDPPSIRWSRSARPSKPTSHPPISRSESAPRPTLVWPSPMRASVRTDSSIRRRLGGPEARRVSIPSRCAAAGWTATTGMAVAWTACAGADAGSDGADASAPAVDGADASTPDPDAAGRGTRSRASSVGRTSSRRDTCRKAERPSGRVTAMAIDALAHRELDARAGIDVGACLEGLAHLPGELGPAGADAGVNRHRDRRAGWIRRKGAARPEGRKGPREDARTRVAPHRAGSHSTSRREADPFNAGFRKMPRPRCSAG